MFANLGARGGNRRFLLSCQSMVGVCQREVRTMLAECAVKKQIVNWDWYLRDNIIKAGTPLFEKNRNNMNYSLENKKFL